VTHLNYKCEKLVHFFDRNVRWLCCSASCVCGCHVLMEVAVRFIYYDLKNLPEEVNED
jgi:hypothetical protein